MKKFVLFALLVALLICFAQANKVTNPVPKKPVIKKPIKKIVKKIVKKKVVKKKIPKKKKLLKKKLKRVHEFRKIKKLLKSLKKKLSTTKAIHIAKTKGALHKVKRVKKEYQRAYAIWKIKEAKLKNAANAYEIAKYNKKKALKVVLKELSLVRKLLKLLKSRHVNKKLLHKLKKKVLKKK